MVQCIDCNRNFNADDLLAKSCQGCGGGLVDDEITALKAQFGFQDAPPPEIEVPDRAPAGDVTIPDVVNCANPDCGLPLYADERDAYLAGGACAYCQQPDAGVSSITSAPPHQELTPTAPAAPLPANPSTPVDWPATSGVPGSLAFYVNTHPWIGTVIDLPLNTDLGRKQIRTAFETAVVQASGVAMSSEQAAWLDRLCERVSGTHFRLNDHRATSMPHIGVLDLGSTNGTYLGRVQVNTTTGLPLHTGLLHLAGEVVLAPCLGMALEVNVGPDTLKATLHHGQAFEIGRLTSDDRRDLFFGIAVHDALVAHGLDPDLLRTMSRRHATLTLEVGSAGNTGMNIAPMLRPKDGKTVTRVSLTGDGAVETGEAFDMGAYDYVGFGKVTMEVRPW